MKNDEHAFTLMEVVVALAILAIVVLTATKNTSNLITNAAYIKEKTLAHWVAMNKATETRLASTWGKTWTDSGDISFASASWHWKLKVEETVDADIRRAEISVARQTNNNTEPLTTLVFYISRPNQTTMKK